MTGTQIREIHYKNIDQLNLNFIWKCKCIDTKSNLGKNEAGGLTQPDSKICCPAPVLSQCAWHSIGHRSWAQHRAQTQTLTYPVRWCPIVTMATQWGKVFSTNGARISLLIT